MTAVFCCIALFFVGCSATVKPAFNIDALTLYVGDTRDITPYVVFDPATASDKSFTLSVEGDCVTSEGKKLTAVKPGTAKIAVKNSGGSAELDVTVEYHAPKNMRLSYDGELVQTVKADKTPEDICFAVSLDDNVDPDTEVKWYVNGQKTGDGKTYTLSPDAYGEYIVSAEAAELEATEVVKIYRETKASGRCDGELEQLRSFSPVKFCVFEDVDSRNPRSVYCWTVNGEKKSDACEFSYVPLFYGEYEVALTVNGVKRDIGGEESITIKASGERAPNARIEFDDRDGVFVLWDDGAAVRAVSITAPDGTRTIYNSFDARYGYRFEPGVFDASELIEVCGKGEYKISVKANHDGEELVFAQYPAAAAQYINEAALCKNSFITSESQARDWLYEVFACGATHKKCYLSREMSEKEHAAVAVAAIQKEAARLGLACTVTRDGEIIDVSIEEYKNYPTAIETGAPNRISAIQPRIESMDSVYRRPNNYTFAIERSKRSVAIENSEQLLIAVQNGVTPVIEDDGAVKREYDLAKLILRSIIGINYTDSQKVTAIHDWLQFCTQRVDGGAGSYADYIDGVFSRGSAALCAVSSMGMAKSVAFMCGIEGIACEIVAAEIQSGYYYYDRVNIDGLWYVVDAYGGEAVIPGTNNECISHSRLFISDARAGELGLAESGPAYDGGAAIYLDKYLYDGVYFDYYVDKAEYDDMAVTRAAIFAAYCTQPDTLTVLTPRGQSTFTVSALGAELILDGRLNAEQRDTVAKNAAAAAAEYGKTALKADVAESDVIVTAIGERLLIMLQI